MSSQSKGPRKPIYLSLTQSLRAVQISELKEEKACRFPLYLARASWWCRIPVIHRRLRLVGPR
jgi:hypothetical protein